MRLVALLPFLFLSFPPCAVQSLSTATAPPQNFSCPSGRQLIADERGNDDDSRFLEWCDAVGIRTPMARLETTPRSVAGRGVFATQDISLGDVVMSIPETLIFHEYNGATKYPDLAKALAEDERIFWENMEGEDNRGASSSKGGKWKRLLGRLIPRRKKAQVSDDIIPEISRHVNDEFVELDDLWQARLTAFSLMSCGMQDNSTKECQTGDNDDWALWISSWRRDDPVHTLIASGATYEDQEKIQTCAEQLHEMIPDIPTVNFQAAIDIRLRRLDALQRLYANSFAMCSAATGVSITDVAVRYSTMCSRAIEIGDGITAVVPMHDMINHSKEPNLALGFDGSNFELIAMRDIAKDEELFIRYTDPNGVWDEISAAWTLVQWGIPESKPAEALVE